MNSLKLMALSLMIVSLGCSAATNNDPQNNDPKKTEVWKPVPPIVSPGGNGIAPSDAIILFDGKSLDEWEKNNLKNTKDTKANWSVLGGVLTVKPGEGNIKTKKKFGDVQLHIEWRAPFEGDKDGQGKGNSGIFFQGRYEIQILNSYNNKTYANGQAGSIYKQHIPLVNAMRPTGEWQVYDIIFKAPRFNDDGSLKKPAFITALHNGVLVQNHVEIKGNTVYVGNPFYKSHGDDVLILQDHSNKVSYRNIWVREL